MAGTHRSKHGLGRLATGWIGPHCVIGRRDLLPQPSLDSCVTLLKRSQSGPHHFAAGGIGTGGNQGIDERRMFS